MLNTIALDGSNVVVKKNGGGAASGGMPIVATEEELQALNLPIGSIASVAQTVVGETSFRNFYQGTDADLDPNTSSFINPDAFNVVSQLKFSFPQEEVLSQSIMITFAPKDISANNLQQITLYVVSSASDSINNVSWEHLTMKDGSPSYAGGNIARLTDGSWEINQERIDELHALLGNGEWVYYRGIAGQDAPLTEEDFDMLDKFCVVISNVTKADAYIKEDEWQELAKQADIANAITTTLNTAV